MSSLNLITEYIKNNLHVELKKNSIAIGSMQCRQGKISDAVKEKLIASRKEIASNASEIAELLDYLDTPKAMAEIYEAARESAKPELKEYEPMPEHIMAPPDFDSFFIAIDLGKSNRNRHNHIIVHKETSQPSKISYDSYEALLPLDAETRKNYILNNRIFCYTCYMPHEKPGIMSGTVKGEEGVYNLLNTHVKPPYYFLPKSNSSEAPERAEEFLSHLFPVESERNWVYEWIYWSLKERAWTFLWLHGVPGVGKGTFSKILRRLHGENNTTELNPNSMKGRFNGSLKDKTLAIWDELKCKEADGSKNVLKSYQDQYLAIERKGIEAETVENHVSHIITTNNISDIELVWNDRKICTPQLSDKNLADVWSNREIEEFNNLIDSSDEWVRRMYDWICSKEYNDNSTHNIFKNSKFYTIVYESLSTWKRFIIEDSTEHISTSGVSVDMLRKRYSDADIKGSSIPTYNNKIDDFLATYRHGPNELFIGRVVQETKNNRRIEFSEEWIQYLKSDIKDNDPRSLLPEYK